MPSSRKTNQSRSNKFELWLKHKALGSAAKKNFPNAASYPKGLSERQPDGQGALWSDDHTWDLTTAPTQIPRPRNRGQVSLILPQH